MNLMESPEKRTDSCPGIERAGDNYMKNKLLSCSAFLLCIGACIGTPAAVAAQVRGGSALDYYNRGIEAQNQEDWYGASEAFQQALQLNQMSGDAWFHLAEVTYELNDYELVLTYLDSADKFTKGRTDNLNLRGMTLISLGRLPEAKAIFTDVLKRFPNDVDARFGLAELELFNGRIDGARQWYTDALKRQSTNRKALLSLALLSAEMGKKDIAQEYLQQALTYHSGEAEVHYLAAYLNAQQGDLPEAERRARAAVQIKSDYTQAYRLLASILYAENRYDEVIDICDYLIARNRNDRAAWYLKGIAAYRKNDAESAVTAWSTGLSIDPQDEIMRSALELLVTQYLPVEDSRRAGWADYHISKAKDFSRRYMGTEARYEYQRALRIDPRNTAARAAFAEILARDGLGEQYLDQMKFVRESQSAAQKVSADTGAAKTSKPSAADTRIADRIEAYDSLMQSSLAAKWNVNPFYLDKTRWHIGIYFPRSAVQLVHPEADSVTAQLAADIFSGVAATAVQVQDSPVSGYGEAFRLARESSCDYFVLLSVEETDREISVLADVYSARTGTLTTHIDGFRTGNDRVSSVLRSFRKSVLDMLPVRGKIVARDGNELLVDLGRTEGMVKGTQLAIVPAGSIRTADQGPGIIYDQKSILGTISLNAVGEEIGSGTYVQNGFYDRVNIGDEVVVIAVPAAASSATAGQPAAAADTTPAAAPNGKRILPKKSTPAPEKKLSPEEMGLVKTPALIQMIRSIN
jgi:tetratricopeptide (TPR) repeat protein